jgi:3',5'-cyclic-AMP phosphodiesterase
VLELRPGPDAVLVSGDLVNDPGAREYERVRELLAPLPMPLYVLAGNHDDRDALREYFAGDGATGGVGEPFRYTARVGDLRLVACDTTLPGHEEGRLDDEHRLWLEAELAADPVTETILAMHHPPLLTGLTALDEIGLPGRDRLALGELLGAHPRVRRVVAGHVHRAAFDVLGGCGAFACPSTYMQAPLEIGLADLRLVPEPPAFALHAQVAEGLVSHLQPIAA